LRYLHLLDVPAASTGLSTWVFTHSHFST